MDYELIPQTTSDRKAAFLAFTGIVGGGLIAYEAASAIREGDVFKTDELVEKPEVGIVAGTAGVVALVMMYDEAAKEVGWKTLVVGTGAVFAAVLAIRAIRR